MKLTTVTLVIALTVVLANNILENYSTATIAQPYDAPNDSPCPICGDGQYLYMRCDYADRQPFPEASRYRF